MRILFFCLNSFLFQNFSEKEIDHLIRKMRKVEFKEGEEVCKQGEFGDKMYFVDRGVFKSI
jgi:CRP-like cAMP-binding protein